MLQLSILKMLAHKDLEASSSDNATIVMSKF